MFATPIIIVISVVGLFLVILLIRQDYDLSRNERLVNLLREDVKYWQEKWKEAMEQGDRPQNSTKITPTTVCYGLRSKQESATQSVQVVEQVSKGKSRKSEQSQSKKVAPTPRLSKKSKTDT